MPSQKVEGAIAEVCKKTTFEITDMSVWNNENLHRNVIRVFCLLQSMKEEAASPLQENVHSSKRSHPHTNTRNDHNHNDTSQDCDKLEGRAEGLNAT